MAKGPVAVRRSASLLGVTRLAIAMPAGDDVDNWVTCLWVGFLYVEEVMKFGELSCEMEDERPDSCEKGDVG